MRSGNAVSRARTLLEVTGGRGQISFPPLSPVKVQKVSDNWFRFRNTLGQFVEIHAFTPAGVDLTTIAFSLNGEAPAQGNDNTGWRTLCALMDTQIKCVEKSP